MTPVPGRNPPWNGSTPATSLSRRKAPGICLEPMYGFFKTSDISTPKIAPNFSAGRCGNRRPILRRLGLIGLSLTAGFCLSAANSFAASITWGTPATITGDTDVATNGVALYAYYVPSSSGGGGAVTAVNGVSFTAVWNVSTWGAGVSLSGLNGTYSPFGAFTSTNTPFSNLSSAYKTVLAGAVDATGGTAATITLNGLVIGHNYTVQFWVNDPRGGYGRTEIIGSTSAKLVYESPNAAGGAGAYAIGTFVADGTSQSFTITGNNATSPSTQLNAIQVRDNGYVGAQATYVPTRWNLAKYQPVITDSTNGTQTAAYLTAGFVDDNNCWVSGNTGPHWAQVKFPFPVTVGSAQLAMGQNNSSSLTNFSIQYLTNGNWVNVPGGTVSGNANVERNVVFPSPITATSFRVYDSQDNPIRIRQLALYPPNGPGGYPFGTDFNIDLARKQPAFATTNTTGGWPLLAADGLVNSTSAWQTTLIGSNSLLINLQFTNKIGSAHLYSGMNGVSPLSDFVLQYWTGSAWANIPGGSVSGNNSGALVILFTTPVTTTKVQLVFTNSGTSAVQELCVFPENSNGGYPLGTGIVSNTPVAAKYDTYSDSFYYLSNSATASVVVESNGLPGMGNLPAYNWASQTNAWPGQYQVLLNYDNGTYRLINRNSGLCLAGAQMTTNAGAALVDETYSALPDQDWYLQTADGINFSLVNQYSGLAVDTQGGALVQNVPTNSPSQLWQIFPAQIFPKKGMAGPGLSNPTIFNADWCYTWWYSTTVTFPFGYNYYPMDFDGHYDRSSTLAGNLLGAQPGWRATGYSFKLLGYNEPDNARQGTIDATNGAIAWLNDQNMDLPLVGPAAANVNGTWNPIFYGYITNWGCRVDYLPAHEYPGNNSSGSSSIWISPLQTAYNTYGIPMWMTEFSVVDWSGTGNWNEEDNYNSLAEFLWRAEQTSWLRKYSLFLFQASASSPLAPNPWTATTPAPNSNSFDTNGVMTPFGELYGAWDDDANVETNKAYYAYNSSTRKHLSNTTGSAVPNAQSILVRDSSSQWTLVPAGSANSYYLVSALDGRELSYNGTTVTLAAAGTTGTAVQWSLASYQYGWYYLQHPASGKELSLAYNNSTGVATYSMVANTTTGTAVQWRFIVPYTPVPVVWTGGANASWMNVTNWNTPLANPNINQRGNYNVIFNGQSIANLATVLNFTNNPAVSNNFAVFSLTVSNVPGPVSIGATNLLAIASGIDLSGASQDLTITAPVYIGVAEGGAGPQFWTVTNTRTLSINGGVAGVAALNLAGGGTVLLGGTNSYTGNTIINAGTLTISGSGSLGSGNYAAAIADNGVFNYHSSASQVLSGNITGSGSLTVNAPGTLTLSGANSYTGSTTISGGTLALSGSGSLSSPSITVAGGGMLDVSGLNLTYVLGGTLANSSVGAMLGGSNNCSAGTLSLVTDGVNPAFIQTNGIMTLSAGTVVTVNNTAATLAPGTYPLIAAATTGNLGSVSGPLPAVVAVTGNGAVGPASLQIDASGNLNLVIGNSSLQAWSGANGTAWTTAGNWLTGVTPGAGSDVWFNGLSTANLATVLNANFNIGTLNVTAPGGPVSIDGSGGLNSLTISNGIAISTASQNLTITAPVVLATSQTWTVTNAITLSANGGVSGSASLSVGGGGMVALGGTNTYTGATTISAGTLTISGTGNLGAGTYAGAIVDSGAFNDNSSAGQILAGIISGSGSVVNSGPGTLTLIATNTYTGATVVSGGTLTIGGAGKLGNGSYAGAIALSNNATLEYSSTAGQTLSGNISGAGALTLDTAAGGTTLSLSGTGNTYGGTTTISNANRLSAGTANISPNTTFNIVGTSSSGGQLYVNSAGTVANNLTLSGVGYNDSGNYAGALRLTSGDTVSGSITTVSTPSARIGFFATSAGNYGETITSQITGSGGMDFYGYYGSLTAPGGVAATNTVTLANTGTPNNYTGNTYIDNNYTAAAGYGGPDNTILRLGASEQIPNGPGAGILLLGGSNPANLNRSCTFELNAFNETVNGIGTPVPGPLDNFIQNTASGASTLTVGDGNTSSTYGGTIRDGGVGRTLALVKIGSGTLALSGVNTYLGTTTVSAGTLALSGGAILTNSASIAVASNAVLDVSGLSSPFTLAQGLGGQTLSNSAPGAILNGTNNCAAGTLSLVADGVNPAFVQTNGTMTLSTGTTILVNNTGSPLSLGAHPLIAAATSGNPGSVTGTLPSVVVNGHGAAGPVSLQINGSGGLDLVVTSVVPPTPMINRVAAAGGNLILQGTNGASSGTYSILTTTNLALPLSSWTTNGTGVFTAGGAFSNSVPITGGGQEYFLIKQP